MPIAAKNHTRTRRVSLNEPEFGDYKRCGEIFNIGRPLLHALAQEGVIESVSLRRRNRVRGKRLYNLQSIRDFISSKKEGQNEPA